MPACPLKGTPCDTQVRLQKSLKVMLPTANYSFCTMTQWHFGVIFHQTIKSADVLLIVLPARPLEGTPCYTQMTLQKSPGVILPTANYSFDALGLPGWQL